MDRTTLTLAVDEVDIAIAPYFNGREADLDMDAIADEIRTAVETSIEKGLDHKKTGEVTVTWHQDGLTAYVPIAAQLTDQDLEAAWNIATGPTEAGGVDLEDIARLHELPRDQRDAAAAAQCAQQGFPQHTSTAAATRQTSTPGAGTEPTKSSDLGR